MPAVHASSLPGPVVALLALAGVVAICRWVFSPPAGRRRPEQQGRPAGEPDYGLLVPVTRVATAAEAQELRALLRDAGIRATVSPSGDGGHHLLVFRADALRASHLVTSR